MGLAETLKRQLPAPDNQGIKLTATTSIVTVILRGCCDGHIACVCLPIPFLLYWCGTDTSNRTACLPAFRMKPGNSNPSKEDKDAS
ncbi:MAG: hypothetical protein ACNYNY_01845 [Candidatus Oxydemutatoraceae bacterium WSBS_2016_MAG_OTU14]